MVLAISSHPPFINIILMEPIYLDTTIILVVIWFLLVYVLLIILIISPVLILFKNYKSNTFSETDMKQQKNDENYRMIPARILT